MLSAKFFFISCIGCLLFLLSLESSGLHHRATTTSPNRVTSTSPKTERSDEMTVEVYIPPWSLTLIPKIWPYLKGDTFPNHHFVWYLYSNFEGPEFVRVKMSSGRWKMQWKYTEAYQVWNFSYIPKPTRNMWFPNESSPILGLSNSAGNIEGLFGMMCWFPLRWKARTVNFQHPPARRHANIWSNMHEAPSSSRKCTHTHIYILLYIRVYI